VTFSAPRTAWLLALVLACGPAPRPPLPPPPTDVSATELPSVETLAAQPPGVYVVTAYVLSNEGCPPCEGHSPCARCDPPGVTVMAARYVPDAPAQPPTVLLETLDFRAFEKNAQYRFTVRIARRDGEHLEPFLQLLGAARVP
jgi:hypothetical protein